MPNFAKILVPIDFSPTSTRALDFAIDFAKRFGASLELLHVEQPLGTPVSPSYMPPILNLDGIAAAARAHCQQQLSEAAQQVRTAGVSAVTTKLLEGFPWREIVNVAEQEAHDLVIIGTHGRGGIERALLGSVAERVVRKAPCPVLTVRSDVRAERESGASDAARL